MACEVTLRKLEIPQDATLAARFRRHDALVDDSAWPLAGFSWFWRCPALVLEHFRWFLVGFHIYILEVFNCSEAHITDALLQLRSVVWSLEQQRRAGDLKAAAWVG